MATILLAGLALTAFDLAATLYGWHIGVFDEANPVMLRLLEISPALAASVAFTVACAFAALFYHYRARPLARIGAWFILGVRVFIAALHVLWLPTAL